jgi:hypothetical protein
VLTDFVYSFARRTLCATPVKRSTPSKLRGPSKLCSRIRMPQHRTATASSHHVKSDLRVQHQALPVQFILPLRPHSVSAAAPMSRARQGNRTVPLHTGNYPESRRPTFRLSGFPEGVPCQSVLFFDANVLQPDWNREQFSPRTSTFAFDKLIAKSRTK